MTKTDIGIYRGLKEKFDPEVHVGFFITTDTGELLLGDQSLGQTISGWEINDGVLILKLNTGRDIRVTFPEATETVKGLLSAADKAQLNALQANLDSKVDKVTGKSLLADSEIEKLAGLPNSTELTNSIATAKAAGDNAQSDLNAHKQNKSNPHEVTKAQVGLGNVTNDAQVKRSEMGVANGVATLDADGKVPASQLPSYVDDIIDVYATYSKSDTGVLSDVTLYLDAAHTQLVTGEAGKIYQNIADGEPQYQFRWTGTIFSQTGASSLILGEVTGTAYDGAKGKANTDNIAKIKGTSLSHIKDAAPVTTATDKVSINYECYEGNQYGTAGTDHTADIPAATTAKAGVMSASDKIALNSANSVTQAMKSVVENQGGNPFYLISQPDLAMSYTDGEVNLDFAQLGIRIVTDTEGNIGVEEAVDIIPNPPVITAATQDQAGVMSAADKVKLDDTATSLANHKANNDKKHIPAGGHERQILAWESDGTAKWDDLANMFTGLEELLAYGVEWKDNVADPHLTRIGNMSLHKTLPIQSQLKGCIAQVDKVIYWLAEDDWRFRKDPIYMDVDLSNDVEHPNFGDASVASLAVGQFVKAGTHIGKIAYIEGTSVTVEWEEDLADISAELTAVTKLEIGSRLDGYDGTVRVYCPNFYIKSQVIGNTRRVWLSTVKIDNTWTYQHEILIDAYRSTVLNTVPENMGYLSTLPVNSAISVVNTATYCRGGGNNSTYDQYLETDPCRTGLGKPRTTGLNRATMRTYARNAGSYIMSYDQYKNIMYWLYVVEYANFNSQEAFNAELTAEGYHQGGMGPGVTNWNWDQWNWYSGNTPITPCGYLNEFGNGTGVKTMKLITPTASGAEPTLEVTFQVPRWRGFDNPFGDIWTNLDGIIIDADADNHPNNMNYVYTCQDPDKFGETLTDDWEKVGEEIHQDGYTKLFNLGDAAHIIPNVMGGNTTQYKCDYHWTGGKNTTLRALLVGGRASYGTNAGLGYFDSGYGVSFSWATVGFRSVSSFVSFQTVEQG